MAAEVGRQNSRKSAALCTSSLMNPALYHLADQTSRVCIEEFFSSSPTCGNNFDTESNRVFYSSLYPSLLRVDNSHLTTLWEAKQQEAIANTLLKLSAPANNLYLSLSNSSNILTPPLSLGTYAIPNLRAVSDISPEQVTTRFLPQLIPQSATIRPGFSPTDIFLPPYSLTPEYPDNILSHEKRSRNFEDALLTNKKIKLLCTGPVNSGTPQPELYLLDKAALLRYKRAGKTCHVEGCDKYAQACVPFCIKHGGGFRCTIPGCTKAARDRVLCASHGGGRRCVNEGCNRLAAGGSSVCLVHGGGKRCEAESCTKKAQSASSFCGSHGGGRRCLEQSCTRLARSGTEHWEEVQLQRLLCAIKAGRLMPQTLRAYKWGTKCGKWWLRKRLNFTIFSRTK